MSEREFETCLDLTGPDATLKNPKQRDTLTEVWGVPMNNGSRVAGACVL